MEVDLKNRDNEVIGKLNLEGTLWESKFHGPLLHQVIVAQLANKRQGNSETLTRAEVSYSKTKLRNQKGGGRSRQGSRGAPQHVKGGVSHGPHQRSYRQKIPKKMKLGALRVAIAEKLRTNCINFYQDIEIETPKTKDVVRLVSTYIKKNRILIVLPVNNPKFYNSCKNIENIELVEAQNLSPLQVMNSKQILIFEKAIDVMENLWNR